MNDTIDVETVGYDIVDKNDTDEDSEFDDTGFDDGSQGGWTTGVCAVAGNANSWQRVGVETAAGMSDGQSGHWAG